MNSKDVLNLLKEKKMTISFAESITGGKLASEFVGNEGASEAFSLGLVTYSNKMKTKLLNVSEETLEKHGVVSAEVVRIMALNVQKMANADISVATSGNAGPTVLGDTNVGDVYVGIIVKENISTYKLIIKEKTRKKIINEVVKEVWNLIYKTLKEC